MSKTSYLIESTKLNNTSAVVPPLASDDINKGYEVGSMWINLETVEQYVCTDNTAGAAKWSRLTKDTVYTTIIESETEKYSELEVATKKFRLGRPIYRTVYTGTLDEYDDQVIPTGLEKGEKCRVADFAVYGQNGITYTQSSSYYFSDTNELRVSCNSDGTELQVNIADLTEIFADAEYEITLEYSKILTTEERLNSGDFTGNITPTNISESVYTAGLNGLPGILNDVWDVEEWDTQNVTYWYATDDHVSFTVSEAVDIYAYSNVWAGDFGDALNVFNTSTGESVGTTSTGISGSFFKLISLSAGSYKFAKPTIGSRIDSKWVILPQA